MTDPKLFRAFLPDFVAYMHRRGGWPDVKLTCAGLKQMQRPSKRDHVCAMRTGRFVPEKHVFFFLELLVCSGDNKHLVHARRVLLNFVNERGVPSIAPEHLDDIISHVCTPILSDPPEEHPDSVLDWMIGGLASLATYPVAYLAHMVFEQCAAADPTKVALWTYIALARQHMPNAANLDQAPVEEFSARYTKVSLQEYARRMQSWAEYNPWTVLYAMKGSAIMGASVMLPVHAHIYESVRLGQRLTSDITPADIIMPSNHILIEALCENPEVLAQGRNPTRAMFFALVAQHAAMMRYGTPGLSRVYKFLAPQGTPENRDRMLANGFKATGIDMPGSVQLWERIMDFDSGLGTRVIDGPTLAQMNRECPSAPRVL